MLGKLKCVLRCLFENRLRFSLTVVSITVALTSVLLVRAVSRYGASAIGEELESLGMNGLVVSSGSGGRLTIGDVEAVGKTQGVSCAAAVTVGTGKIACDDGETSAMFWGIDETAQGVVSFDLDDGRLIDKGDVSSNASVCMIDASLASKIFTGRRAVGRTIDVMCGSSLRCFKVVGVVKTGRGIMQSLMGNYFPAFLYIPYTSFGGGADFTQVFVKTDGLRTPSAVGESLKEKLGETVSVTDLASQQSALESLLSTVTTILTLIGGVSLLVSGISIMNTMLISVGERTKEIGIKKSIGASRGDILLDFLLESVIIAFAGTLIGVLLSAAICACGSAALGIDMRLPFGEAALSIPVAAALGTIFGIFPAIKASKLKPVEALRR